MLLKYDSSLNIKRCHRLRYWLLGPRTQLLSSEVLETLKCGALLEGAGHREEILEAVWSPAPSPSASCDESKTLLHELSVPWCVSPWVRNQWHQERGTKSFETRSHDKISFSKENNTCPHEQNMSWDFYKNMWLLESSTDHWRSQPGQSEFRPQSFSFTDDTSF